MAGKTVSPEAAKVNDIVLGWMFDYICYRVWEQFSSNKSISESDKDVVQGLSGLMNKIDNYPLKHYMRQKFLFMVNICRLDDGEDITSHYDPDSDETPLESMMTTFKSLVDLQDQEMKEEGKKLLSIIKSEAVLVCCRAGDFDSAKSVFTALWDPTKLDHEEKKTRKLLKTMVEESNADHEHLRNYTYSNFVDTMKKYLKKIYNRFQKPVLLEAAEKKLAEDKEVFQKEKESHAGRKRKLTDKNLSLDSLKGCRETSESNSGRRNDDSSKLRKLWNKNNAKLFEADPSEVITQSSVDRDNSSAMEERNNNNTRVSKAEPSPSKRRELEQTNDDDDDVGSDILMPAPPQPLTRRSALPASSQSVLRRPAEKDKTLQPVDRPRENSPTSTSADDGPRTSTPEKEKQPSGSGENMTYRKNVGRPNRHHPQPENERKKTTLKKNWDEISADFSFTSTATTRTKWTEEDTEEFFKAVSVIGVGKWREIRDYLGTSRTNVMLKDKWRNMLKTGEVERFTKMFSKGKKK